MALEKMGIGIILGFDGRTAIAGMNRARASFRALGSGVRKFGGGLRKASMGLTQLSIVGAGAAIVLGSMTKTAAEFQHQMGGVQAVSQATTEQMSQFTEQAKRLGATTAFTAIQAAKAQENLSRAGFSVNEVLKATPAILDAAAAEGMDLAKAADIVSSSIRGMGLAATDAGRVSDVLALSSAKSNTNMIALGEAFKFAAPTARTLGFSLEETAAALGKAADAGLRGTIGGTSFTNMLLKLAKPSSKAAALMKKWKISLDNADGSIRPLADIMGDLKTKIDEIPQASKRFATAAELTGLRGQKAYSALSAVGSDAVKELTAALENSKGAAAEMARIRLDTVTGAVTILKSAWEGLQIELGEFMLRNASVKDGIRSVTRFVSDLVLTLQGQTKAVREVNGEFLEYNPQLTMAGKVAKGLQMGLETVTTAFKDVVQWVSELGKKFGVTFGGDMVSKIAQVSMILLTALAAIAPIGALVFTLGIAFSGIASIVSGLGASLAALFGPLGIVIAGVIAGFMMIRKEGEGIGQTFIRVFGVVKGWIVAAAREAGRFAAGFKLGIGGALDVISGLFNKVKTSALGVYNTIADILSQGGGLQVDWKAIGLTVGNTLSMIAKFFGPSVMTVIDAFAGIATTLAESILPNLRGLWFLLKPLLAISFLPMLGPLIIGWKIIIPLAAKVAEGIAVVVGWIIKAYGEFGNKLVPIFTAGWNIIANTARIIWHGITTKVIQPAWTFIKGVAFGIRNVFTTAFKAIATVARSIFSRLALVLAAPFQKVLAFIKTIVSKVASTTLGKAALGAAGVTTEAVAGFGKLLGELAAGPIGAPKLPDAAKAVSDGTLDAAERSPASRAMKEMAIQRGQVVGSQQPCVTVENEVKVGVDSKLSVDGSEMSVASASHQAEVSERAGFSTTPWQKRRILEVGAIPATGGVPS